MLGMLGIKKDIDISLREKFAITSSKKNERLKGLLKYFAEAVIINTCNRTEIYINYDSSYDESYVINRIFDSLRISM